ncbi:MAG: chaperone modulator CbpM [Flavobacteriia bacterium]|nr:chaperone modulator CbpM [Flavobacteriia bacterium]
MELESLICLHEFCDFHKIENSFVLSLNEHDLVKIFIVEGKPYLHNDSINQLEKIIRLYHDLDINFEGIDVIIQLLNKINNLQEELQLTKNKLKQFEQEEVVSH